MPQGSKNPKTSYSIWLKTLALANLIILTFLFSSCSDDNPVKTAPVSEFDSARFNWRAENVYYRGFAGIWAQDTGNIFLLNNYNRSLYKVSGGNTSIFYAGDYYLNDIKGLSNSEVYLFGSGLYDNKLTIIKWNGAGFETHVSNVIVNPSNTRFIWGCAVSSNEIWTCSQFGICKFDGQKITNYAYGDSAFNPDYLFLSDDNKMRYIGAKQIDTFAVEVSLYEFQNTGFIRTYDYVYGLDQKFLLELGGHTLGMELFYPASETSFPICMKYFTGSGFTDYFCFNDKIRYLYKSVTIAGLAGMDLQNFILIAQTDHSIFQTGVGIINWNGNKPSKELMLTPYHSPYDYDAFILFAINNDNYLVIQPDNYVYENTYLFIGTKK